MFLFPLPRPPALFGICLSAFFVFSCSLCAARLGSCSLLLLLCPPIFLCSPARVSLVLSDFSAFAPSTPPLFAIFLLFFGLPLPTCNRPALPCRCCLFFLFVCLRFVFLAVHCVLQGSAPALCCCFFPRPSFFVPPLGFPWFCLTSRPLPLRPPHFLLFFVFFWPAFANLQ